MNNQHTFLFALILMTLTTFGQKKPLTVADFDSWKQIEHEQLSENGQYFVYEYNPGMGDGVLVITDLTNGETDSIPRGFDAKISGNSDFVAFKIKPQIDIRRKEETEKTKKNKKSKDSLGIYLFKISEIVKYANNFGFQLPEEGKNWLAFKTIAKAKKDTLDVKIDTLQDKKKKKTENDTIVVAYNPLTKDSITFKNVSDYSWAKKADVLLISQENEDSVATNSVLVKFVADAKKTDTLFAIKGFIKKASLSNSGKKIGFLTSTDTTKIKNYQLHFGSGHAIDELTLNSLQNLTADWLPSENQSIYFSEDGNKLFFGVAKAKVEHPKDTLLNSEREKLDIWSWTDDELQPMQKVNLKRDKSKTYLSVYNFETGKAIQLADILVPDIRVLNKGKARYFLGTSDLKYKKATSWSALFIDDFYQVDAQTGAKKLLVEGQNSLWMGPSQEYAVYYNRKDSVYYSINLKTEKHLPLTKGLPVVFYDETHDAPSDPRPYGVAGWSKNDAYVFIYDRFDIWKIDPSGKKNPERVTGNGREHTLRYRYVQLDKEEEFIDPKKVLLSVFNETNKQSGCAYTNLLKEQTPKTIFVGDYRYGNPVKAKNENKLVYTRETYNEYPDYWFTDTSFKNPVKITNGGEQLKKYKWGKVRLEEWTNYDGVKLQGLLYVPEDLDPNKKYPLVSYFYELKSDTYHQFYDPTPSRSTINKAFYPSNDYIVFIPDIVYKKGYPGQSAYNCIVSGIEAMENKYSFIDSEHLALQGQSWGGYQTAYIITQTDKFAAAMAGAPVSNMTSAYGGIRWGSGMSRMFQYEHTQSRIGGTLWDKLDLYMENSPLFEAPKITTPLLMMHNDNDGAVPWYQGIEFFVALRRLNKPVWMLSYNGEPHNLKGTSWGDRKDLSIRMMQFFDHYLKGKPAPQWMQKGRSAVEKEFNKGY